MKWREHRVDYLSHSSYDEYVQFLRQSVKPACQNCIYLKPTINTYAIQVLNQAGFFNERRTKITGIDPEAEEDALINAQYALLAEVEECAGQVAVRTTTRADFDNEQAAF